MKRILTLFIMLGFFSAALATLPMAIVFTLAQRFRINEDITMSGMKL